MNDIQLQHDQDLRRHLADMRHTLRNLLADLDAIDSIGGAAARAAFLRHWRDVMHARLDKAAVSLGSAALDARGVLGED
jgi:hypothetical protein